MAGITLEQAEAQLASYLAAETAVLSNQSYEIAGRKFTRTDLDSIQSGIKIWNDRVNILSQRAQGRSRSRTVVVGS
jgi:Family of unknown function (DUF6148)